MTKPIDIDTDDLDENLDNSLFDEDETAAPSVTPAPLTAAEQAAAARDYSERRVLVWEEDDERCRITVEVLSDLLIGAYVKGVKTEKEALALLDGAKWDTFVVDFSTEGVSMSEFIKKVNNRLDAILVAISMTPLRLLEEREATKLEPLRRLFDYEKNAVAPIRA